MAQVIVEAARRLPINFKSLPVIGSVAYNLEQKLAPTPFDKVAPGLYVGSSRAGRDYADRFHHRISVADGLEYETTTASFDLIPTNRNQEDQFVEAVEATVDGLNSGMATLVHCHEGRERAPTVAATALAAQQDWSFSKAIEYVREDRPVVEPTSELRELAREYLD